MNQPSNPLKPKSKPFIYFISLAITCGSFVMGYALVSTALLQDYISLVNNVKITQMDFFLSIIITLLPFGAIVGIFIFDKFIGSLVSKSIINKYGQKKCMIIVDVIMIIAILMQAYSLDLAFMYISRFMFGLFCGISSTIIPTYLTSISPLQMTGIIGSFNQLMITIGISVAYAMEFFLQSKIMKKEYEVAIFILLPSVFCVLRILVLCFIFPYDTIQRHFKLNQEEIVKNIIQKIYVNPKLQDYCRVKNLTHKQNQPKSSSQYSNSIAKKRILCLSIVLAIANQLCGINAIFFYAKQLFDSLTHNNQEQVERDLLGLGLFQVFITYVSALVLDKFGRRFLMLLGQSIVVISLVGAFFATDIFGLSSSMVAFFIFLHILGFSISLGPISVLYASQMMQDISLMIILLWLLTLVVALVSDIMINSLGIGKTFLIFGIISLLCLIYLWKEMLETKGLNRKQIEKKFQGKCGIFRMVSSDQFQEMQEVVSNDYLQSSMESIQIKV